MSSHRFAEAGRGACRAQDRNNTGGATMSAVTLKQITLVGLLAVAPIAI
jgi:hypothetical protein